MSEESSMNRGLLALLLLAIPKFESADEGKTQWHGMDRPV